MKSLSQRQYVYFITALVVTFIIGIFVGTGRMRSLAPRVYYSLDERQNDQAIISVIEHAHSYVHFAIYEFTKDDIAEALIAAKEKGLDVEGITDRENSVSESEAPIVAKLRAAGIPVEIQVHDDGIMHIKAIVTDNEYASGSYNWTTSATVANDEVLEVGSDEATRSQYESIIEKILATNKSSLSGAATSTVSDAAPVSIDFSDAGNHIGQNAAVTGTVDRVYVSANGTVFFDYCTNYKSCPFSAVIFADDAKSFPDISEYQSKTITVTGTIKEYGGTPEIVIDSPSDIQIGE